MKLDGIPRDLVDELDKASARLGRLERRPRGLTVGEVPTSVSTYAQDDPPAEPITVGSLWVDTDDDNKIYRWDGLSWVLVRDAGVTEGQALAAVLMIGAMDVQGAADNLVTTYYTDTAPSGALSVGDLWADSGSGGLSKWSGTAWVDQANTDVAAALADASNAKALADGRVKTWWQFDPPTAEGIGDLWVDTNDGDKAYRWSGTRWVSVLSVGIDDLAGIVNGKITTFYLPDATPPTATAVGDLWVVTDMDNLIRRWDGAAWVDVQIGDLGLASLGVGKLLAGTLQVLVELTTGGRIVAGDEAGAHVIMDPAGVRAYSDAVTQTFELNSTDGSAVLAGTVQSTDFVDGVSGWDFSSEDSQVNNLNVLSEVGASLITCQGLTVNGVDFGAGSFPRGLVASAALGDPSRVNSQAIAGTEVIVVQIAAGELDGTRAYLLGARLTTSAAGAVDNTMFLTRVRSTSDGSKPTTSSSIVDGSLTRFVQATGASSSANILTTHGTPAGVNTMRYAVSLQRLTGTGTATVSFDDSNNKLKFWILDVGDRGEATVAVSQVNKVSGLDDPDPTADVTRSWSATWGQSYNADGSRYVLAGNDLFQGTKPGGDTHGNTRSLIGFDFADIATTLGVTAQHPSGATVTDVRLTFRVKATALNSGANLQIGTHSYTNTTAPATWLAGQVTQARAVRTGVKGGGTYRAALPVAVGGDLKSGTANGIALGPGVDASALQRLFLYGVGSGQPPVLSISYRV